MSGNILKNVKSVIVPNTGGLKGINAAIAAGIIAGRAEKVLQVISYVTQEEHSRIREYMEVTPLAVSCSDNGGCWIYGSRDTGAATAQWYI